MSDILILSLEEIGRQADEEKRKRLIKGKWGAWYRKRGSLGINRCYPYEVPISIIKEGGPLSWFAHLRQKIWLQRGDLEDLIQAFNDLFGYNWIYNGMKGNKETRP